MIKIERVLLLSVLGACVGSSSGDPTTATTSQELAGSTASAQVSPSFLRGATPHAANHAHVGGHHQGGVPNSVPGVDSVANFGGQFTLPGFDSTGNPQSVWPYTMVGAGPSSNHPTAIRAPVIPTTVELLDATGHVGTTPSGAPLRMVIDQGTVDATVQSPVFQPFTYNSGRGQFNDQMMRSMFWSAFSHHGNGDDNSGYHTVLAPTVTAMRTIQIPFGAYRYAPKPDGSCCMFVLADINQFANQLFPATATDTTTVLGAAEHNGDITTKDITTVLFKDVYLYDGDPAACCILGFHSYDAEPGDASNHNRERRYVMNYSSWITPGLFGFGFSDVIEVLTNPVHAIPMAGRTYHPQNEAMLPWFAGQSPSTAYLGAYSFPDESVLLGLSPQGLPPNCTP